MGPPLPPPGGNVELTRPKGTVWRTVRLASREHLHGPVERLGTSYPVYVATWTRPWAFLPIDIPWWLASVSP